MFDDASKLLTRVLKLGALLVGAIALVGSLVGFMVAGVSGVLAALVGSLAAFMFMTLTVFSIFMGAKLQIGGFMGLVLGGWLLKMVLFILLFVYLNGADWLTSSARPMVFFTIVAAVISGLVLDTWIVSKARLSPNVKLP